MLDIFSNNAFSLVSLTDAVNKMPFVPGRVGALGLFEEKGITTTNVVVEEQAGVLNLLATTPRGAAGSQYTPNKRKARSLLVPHLQEEGTLLADEVQNVRAFGSADQLQTVQAVVNERLADMIRKHDATVEYGRIGAIKGQILDADGSSVIYNLFDEFGVAQQTENFALTTDTTKVRAKCLSAARKIEDELGAAPYTRLRALCGKGFFDALIDHPNVAKAYENYVAAAERLGGDVRGGFEFAGIMFEEYRGKVGPVSFVGDDEAYILPEGVPGLFKTYFAPADFIETANTIGLPRYAKQAVDPQFQRFVTLHTQSNPLSLCLRPRAVVKATKS